MNRITAEWLKEHDACASQVRKFKKVFLTGAPVSLRSLQKAAKAGIEWGWLEQFCGADFKAKRASLYADYNAKYDAKLASLYADYNAKLASLLIAALLRVKR
jgi:hypothetical protein